MIHELKIWPEFYMPVVEGKKTFEIRKNDRDFKVGDELYLREWIPEGVEWAPPGYTGWDATARILYVLPVDKVEMAGMTWENAVIMGIWVFSANGPTGKVRRY